MYHIFDLQLFGKGGGGGGQYTSSPQQNRLFDSQAKAMDSFNAYSENMRNVAQQHMPQNTINWGDITSNANSQYNTINNKFSELANGNIDISPMQSAINRSTIGALGSFAAAHPNMMGGSMGQKAMNNASEVAASKAAENWSAEGSRQANTLNAQMGAVGQNIANQSNIQTGAYMPFNTFTQAAFGGSNSAAQMGAGATQNTPTYVQNSGGKF